jgi:hypothetical protein
VDEKQTAPTQDESQGGKSPEQTSFDPFTASRGEFVKFSLDELADYAASTKEGTMMSGNVYSEIKRRDMILQVKTLEATLKAAKASEDAACQSRRNATWMMRSVLVAAISAAVAAASVALPFLGFSR